MCLDLLLNMTSLAIAMEDWLSQYNGIGNLGQKPKSLRSHHNHTSSLELCTIAMYSASVVDCAFTDFFLDFHATGPPIIIHTYPVMDLASQPFA